MHIIRDFNVSDNTDLSGKGAALADTCTAGDANASGVVNAADVTIVLGCLSGPDIPADPDCAN